MRGRQVTIHWLNNNNNNFIVALSGVDIQYSYRARDEQPQLQGAHKRRAGARSAVRERDLRKLLPNGLEVAVEGAGELAKHGGPQRVQASRQFGRASA